MNTCYTRRRKGWNCNEWLSKTDICKLPNRSEGQVSESMVKRKPNQPKAELGPLKIGPRGGKYREVKQGDCIKKIYYRK